MTEKQKPSWCPYGKDVLWCQDCEHYYFAGLGFCEKSHPIGKLLLEKEKKDGDQE